jgi:hypothetical protein
VAWSWRPVPLWLRPGERGSVTVEIAVALPALVVVMAVALWGVSAAAAQVACVDAARAGARAAARGEPVAAVRAAVLRAAPHGSSVDLVQDSLTTRVAVHAMLRSPIRTLFPALVLRADAVAATEPLVATPHVADKPRGDIDRGPERDGSGRVEREGPSPRR